VTRADRRTVETGAASPDAAVRLDGVSKVYGRGRDALLALDGVSFAADRGAFISILGASGCGKSTLLSLIAGLDPITSGTIDTSGHRVALMFQEPALFPWLTVTGNVEIALRMRGVPRHERRPAATQLLETVRLRGFEHKRPHELSGGMRQRVALARALGQEADVLLMDEPFGALDELTRLEMNDLLLRIRKETGASVLFVTHSISEAVYLADKVIVFSRRPARVATEIPVSLPYPRSQQLRFTPAFTQAERQASVALGVVPATESAA
jgi:NitT/TauT family transport system ATP-binding protein